MKKILSFMLLAAMFASCQNNQNKAAKFNVNEKVSRAEWKGSAPDHFHIGSFKVTGVLSTDGQGTVNGGDFVIPIASIEDFDLPAKVKPVLLADLKDNFFKIAVNPDAKFHVTAVTPYAGTDTSAGKGANYMLKGDFTMLGQTHSITFPARIDTKEGNIAAEAKFDLNRLTWGMNNYSDATKKLYILPTVNIHLKLQASAQKNNEGNVAYLAPGVAVKNPLN